MYQFSRAIYRELAPMIIEDRPSDGPLGNHERVLHACESSVERLANDRYYFARPARTLFNDVRVYFPVCEQERVYRVIEHYLAYADEFVTNQARTGYDINGNRLQCRACTRRGTPCRRMPLPHNGYCPSHQHLAETEQLHGASVAA